MISPSPDSAISDLIAEISAVHHRCLHHQVSRLETIIAEIVAANDGQNPIVTDMRQLISGLRGCVETSLSMEEQVLFPMLQRLQQQTSISRCRSGMIKSRAAVAERDLARIRGVVMRLRELAEELLSPDGPCEFCHELTDVIDALVIDLREHTRKESEVLFPWAVAREASITA